jgi:hypothetical protein
MYEIVMREGTDDDVRRFIDLDELIAMCLDCSCQPRSDRPGLNSSGCTGAFHLAC